MKYCLSRLYDRLLAEKHITNDQPQSPPVDVTAGEDTFYYGLTQTTYRVFHSLAVLRGAGSLRRHIRIWRI